MSIRPSGIHSTFTVRLSRRTNNNSVYLFKQRSMLRVLGVEKGRGLMMKLSTEYVYRQRGKDALEADSSPWCLPIAIRNVSKGEHSLAKDHHTMSMLTGTLSSSNPRMAHETCDSLSNHNNPHNSGNNSTDHILTLRLTQNQL